MSASSSRRTPVIRSDAHLGHAGLVELVGGREVPCYESPERVIEIERSLREDGGFAFAPDAPIILSLGFDTFERDPIGDLALRTPDYLEIGRMIGALGAPVVELQEGGYALDAIGANAVAFLTGLREGYATP